MKNILPLCGLLLALALPARASIDWTYSGAAINITDGNAVGVFNSYTLPNSGGPLTGVHVNYSLTGGRAGDLVGYLMLNNGGTSYVATLFNRPGTDVTPVFGSSADASSLNQTDQVVTSSFSGVTLGANSTWTLYLADLATGGGTSQLTGWGLSFSGVPEPTTWALLGFASLAGLTGLARCWQRRTA